MPKANQKNLNLFKLFHTLNYLEVDLFNGTENWWAKMKIIAKFSQKIFFTLKIFLCFSSQRLRVKILFSHQPAYIFLHSFSLSHVIQSFILEKKTDILIRSLRFEQLNSKDASKKIRVSPVLWVIIKISIKLKTSKGFQWKKIFDEWLSERLAKNRRFIELIKIGRRP